MIDWLAQRALACPERTALVDEGGRAISYAELDRSAGAIAGALRARGHAPGEPIGLAIEPSLDGVALLHGALRAGCVARMLPPGSAGEPGEPVLREPPELGEGDPQPFRASPEAEDTLALIRTSGTSGSAREVALSFANFEASAAGSAFNLGVDPADRWLCCLPLHHVGGLSIPIRSVIYGTTAVLHLRFETDRVAAALAGGGISVVSLVATQLRRLLEAGADVAAPRAILLGGGPVPADLVAEASARGARVATSYGLTEACSQVTAMAPAESAARPGASGRPLLGARVEIAGADGPGELGEILVSGPVVARGSLAADGRLHTGDLGELDDDGYLWVRDRISDMIVTGGENVIPADVEAALRSHPGVSDAAVVGLPDREWQEAVTAFVVASGDPPEADELRRFVAGRLARHEVPKTIHLVPELPRGPSGKLRRRELREHRPPPGR